MPAKATAPDSTERVMIFIDGSNLYHVLSQNCGRYDLVFEKFSTKLGDGRDVVRTYYYNIRQDPTFNPTASAEQEKFLTALFETPYFEVRLGVHRRHGDQMVEKGVDVMMATDLVVGAFRDVYDTAIVVSGDGDFYPAMQAAKDLGKHIEVVAFDSNLSPEAKRVADSATLLKKSYFTGLWTSRSRAPAKKKDDDEKKPAIRRRSTSARSSDADDNDSGSDSDKPARRTPTRTSTRRRRPVRSNSNGVSADTPETETSESTESPETPEIAEAPEADETPSTRRPVRRRRAPMRRGGDAEDTAVAEREETSGDTGASDSGAAGDTGDSGDSGDSGSDDNSSGGNWWSRRKSDSSE